MHGILTWCWSGDGFVLPSFGHPRFLRRNGTQQALTSAGMSTSLLLVRPRQLRQSCLEAIPSSHRCHDIFRPSTPATSRSPITSRHALTPKQLYPKHLLNEGSPRVFLPRPHLQIEGVVALDGLHAFLPASAAAAILASQRREHQQNVAVSRTT